eukprot:UN10465
MVWRKLNIGQISSLLLPFLQSQSHLISVIFHFVGPGYTAEHLDTLRVKAIHGCVEDFLTGFRVDYWNGRCNEHALDSRKRLYTQSVDFNVHQLIIRVEVYSTVKGVAKIRFITSTGSTHTLVAVADPT